MSAKNTEVSDYFSNSHLDTIKDAIKRAEGQTSGEIRVKVILNCDHDLEGKVHDQAVREFEKEGMHNTHDKTGVLILIVLDERRFAIIGDSGIYRKLPQDYWDNMAKAMSSHCKNLNFHLGICMVIENIGQQLAKHFPKRRGDVNELSDDVIIGGDVNG